MRRGWLIVPALLLAAAGRDDPLAGRIAGKPVDCLDDSDAQSVRIVDPQTIVYSSTGRRLWVTRPVGTCPSLRPDETLIVERFGSQLCRGDRFRTIDPPTSIPSGYCRFDSFTTYDKPPR